MCGIAGFFDEQLEEEDSRPLISKMLEVTMHRGPDYSSFGFYEKVVLEKPLC